jgi:hypothetical protein
LYGRRILRKHDFRKLSSKKGMRTSPTKVQVGVKKGLMICD